MQADCTVHFGVSLPYTGLFIPNGTFYGVLTSKERMYERPANCKSLTAKHSSNSIQYFITNELAAETAPLVNWII
jgi:hypothetical protein